MKRSAAIVMTLSLMLAALLFATDSWNGFSVTANKTTFGGYGSFSYPALAAGESISATVIVVYPEYPPPTQYYYRTINGPCSSGSFNLGGGLSGASVQPGDSSRYLH